MMNTFDYWEVHFLVVLSDGKKRGWMQYMMDSGRVPTPMSQLKIQRMADNLRKRGLIKDTWGGYQITPTGLDAAKQAALEMMKSTVGAREVEQVGMTEEAALEIVRKSFRW